MQSEPEGTRPSLRSSCQKGLRPGPFCAVGSGSDLVYLAAWPRVFDLASTLSPLASTPPLKQLHRLRRSFSLRLAAGSPTGYPFSRLWHDLSRALSGRTCLRFPGEHVSISWTCLSGCLSQHPWSRQHISHIPYREHCHERWPLGHRSLDRRWQMAYAGLHGSGQNRHLRWRCRSHLLQSCARCLTSLRPIDARIYFGGRCRSEGSVFRRLDLSFLEAQWLGLVSGFFAGAVTEFDIVCDSVTWFSRARSLRKRYTRLTSLSLAWRTTSRLKALSSTHGTQVHPTLSTSRLRSPSFSPIPLSSPR